MTTAPIILGTAGHIDHGKSALIKALTGVDPDRLKEEKLRGITIELGFADLTLPSGQHLGIVDVPGHERFVRHMVAGASGMDLVALVIAADEGVMPQTREHLEICQLLRVKQGLVVLTKVDLVEPDWLELVEEEVREALKGTFLDGAPIVGFSAVTGFGKENLLATLATLAAQVLPKPVTGIFRLPIDRVFTIKGFGTVVTGTAISGRVKVAEAVAIYPPGFKAKVRGLQVHGQAVEAALAGNRTAVNLQGLEKEELERGMVVAPPGALIKSRRLDAFLEILPSAPRPLKHRQAVRLHTGTSERVAMPLILDADEMAPGSAGYVQFFLREPLALKPGDRLVIRSFSPAFTWGGGLVLHVNPTRHKRRNPEVLARFKVLEQGSPEDVLRLYLSEAGAAGRSRAELTALLPWDPGELANRLNAMTRQGQVLNYDQENQRYLLTATAQELEQRSLQILTDYHRKFPLKPGLSKEELRRQLPPAMEVRLFNYLLGGLAQKKQLVSEKDLVRLSTHKVTLGQDQEDVSRRLEELYRKGLFSPPTFKEATEAAKIPPDKVKQLLQVLVNQGRLIKVKDDLYFHQAAIEALKAALIDFLKQNREITVNQFKDLTQTSRKFSIPLLEYFDSTRTTVRVGETRRLREGA
ncbi:MAG: selenocysteine-specific translation elongation factor [Desulfobacterales bacterium]|nr:selenocysteine-specific translation elongation factor [Pseudomonadota bacterium]MCG2772762.1 selenocysteine-specific translation elongation factor [Desulfobacterales bacterium]